jgi:uncharacterized C2H2 Zn-finger protein
VNGAIRRWAEAERLLAGDPSTRVRCPSCGGDFLVVAEVEGEVHMTCPRCLDRHVARRGR